MRRIGGVLLLVVLAACGDIGAHRFRVVGRDIYGLDADGDGIACES